MDNKYVKLMPPSIRDGYKKYREVVSAAGRRKKTTKGAFGGKKTDQNRR